MAGSHRNWLNSRERFGVKLGLDSIRALLAELGDPHIDLPAVLVAGTNGKGSTAAMIAAVLTAAGRKTLLYTSPHVASVSERIRIDGTPIRSDALERRLGEVRSAVKRLARGGGEGAGGRGGAGALAGTGALESAETGTRAGAGDPAWTEPRSRAEAPAGGGPMQPTYFEVLTAAALLHARACRVTAAVFEIGLGGRYDATNVIPAPVAVITGIERDHTEYLGTTLKKIAWNKAGIIKPGQTVLTLEARPELVRVFCDECRRRGATLVKVPGRCARRVQADGGTRRLAGRGAQRGQAARGTPPQPADRWDLDLRVAQRLAGEDRLPGQLAGVRLGLRGPRQGPQAVLALAAAARLLAVTEDNGSLAISGGMSRSRTMTPEKNRSISQSRTMTRADNRSIRRSRTITPAQKPSRAASSGKARPLSARTLRRALAGVRLPGRFELRRLSQRRLLVADAAHNPAAAALLAAEIRDLAGERPVTLLFSALADKDAEAMLKPLMDVVDTVNLTRIQHRRGMKIKDLNDLARWVTKYRRQAARDRAGGEPGDRHARPRLNGGKRAHLYPATSTTTSRVRVRVYDDPCAAWAGALAGTPARGILLVAGSFYLLGDLWPRIRRHPLRS